MNDPGQQEKKTRGRKGRMRRRKGEELTIRIDELAQGGRGVGRADGVVVFVPLTAPGDLVRARVTRTYRRHMEAELVEVVEPSPDRREAPCPYFGRCGGCAWQHVSYEAQLRAKERIVKESLERLGGLPRDLPYHPIVPSPEVLGYRNKMEFSFDPDEILGLHLRGHFDRVLGLDDCLLPSRRASAIMRDVKSFVVEKEIPAWNRHTGSGLLRHLVVREARGTGELMVSLVTTSEPFPDAAELASRLAERHPGVACVIRAVNDSPGDAVAAERLEVLHGRSHIVELLGGVPFRVELQTFFQTNTPQAETMAALALRLADLKGHENVVDLFCGVGTFALMLAKGAKRVFGLEVVEPAIAAAEATAAREGMDNVTFMAADARRGLPILLERIGAPPDLLLLDPPRSGAGGKVMRRIARSAPKTVIYISCNPSSLAPDLGWLVPFGYRITDVRPLDMFPQTHHIETIVRLERTPEADGLPDPFKRG